MWNSLRQAHLKSSRGMSLGMTCFPGWTTTHLSALHSLFMWVFRCSLGELCCIPPPGLFLSNSVPVFPQTSSSNYDFLWNSFPMLLYHVYHCSSDGRDHRICFVYCCLWNILKSCCICLMPVGLGKWTCLVFANSSLTCVSFSVAFHSKALYTLDTDLQA